MSSHIKISTHITAFPTIESLKLKFNLFDQMAMFVHRYSILIHSRIFLLNSNPLPWQGFKYNNDALVIKFIILVNEFISFFSFLLYFGKCSCLLIISLLLQVYRVNVGL
jgi:hypothetical protein